VRIHYAITNTGGYSPNVVQSYAEVLYLIRAKDVPSVQKVFERVNKIADGAALMTETTVEKDFIKACSNLVPNLTLCQLIHDNLELAGVPEFTQEDMDFAQRIVDSIPAASRENPDLDFNRVADPELRAQLKEQWGDKPIHGFLAPVDMVGSHNGGSTDVGDVSCIAPTVMFHTTTQAIGTPGHSWQHVAQNKSPLAKKGMLFASKGMAGAAIDLFENPDLLALAKAEHAERMNHQAYTCPIPQGVKPRSISVKK
jgi:aminobenzoyl-glutamate utilization protein B